MRRVMVRYKVLADRAEENERLVRAVFAELVRTSPAGIRYATFKLPDGVSFMHLASIETDDGTNPLAALETFRTFSKDIAARCEEPPVAVDVEVVGQFGVLG